MRSLRIGDCDVDIIPIVKGLISERQKAVDALANKDYEAAAVAWSIQSIEAVRRRAEITDEYDVDDLDTIYSYKLTEFGPIDRPDPAFTYVIDTYAEHGRQVIPLDMTDEDYTDAYCRCVSTFDFLKENKIVKKAMKREFTKESPEAFVREWDALVNEIKGYRKLSEVREEYIAEQIKDIARYKKSALILVEYERFDGIMRMLEGQE